MSLIGPEHWIERIQGLLADLDGQLASIPEGPDAETSRQVLLGLRDKFVEGMAQLEAASMMSLDEGALGDLGGIDDLGGDDGEETTDKIRLEAAAAAAAAGATSGEVPAVPEGGAAAPDGPPLTLSPGSLDEAAVPPAAEAAAAEAAAGDAPFDDGDVTRSGP